jgi:Uma2 family endonuclease
MVDRFNDAARKLPHRIAPAPLHFPVESSVPESVAHLLIRMFLFRLLRWTLRGRAAVGSDQFVYFDASDPRRCLAPDLFVKWDRDDELFKTWKTWEGGVPELCVEVESEGSETSWMRKLAEYQALGVREVVRFDPESPPRSRLRVWDRLDDVLVERALEGDATPCVVLGLHWVVRPIEGFELGLRLARDAEGSDCVLDERETAEARVAELERTLKQRVE